MGILRRLLNDYSDTWSVKAWAFVAYTSGLLLMTMGGVLLTCFYTGVIEQLSLIGSWTTTSLGFLFYCVSYFGMKSPKQLKKEAKKEDNQK